MRYAICVRVFASVRRTSSWDNFLDSFEESRRDALLSFNRLLTSVRVRCRRGRCELLRRGFGMNNCEILYRQSFQRLGFVIFVIRRLCWHFSSFSEDFSCPHYAQPQHQSFRSWVVHALRRLPASTSMIERPAECE